MVLNLEVRDVPWRIVNTNKLLIITKQNVEAHPKDIVKLTYGKKFAYGVIEQIVDDDEDLIKMNESLRNVLEVNIGDNVQLQIEKIPNIQDAKKISYKIIPHA